MRTLRLFLTALALMMAIYAYQKAKVDTFNRLCGAEVRIVDSLFLPLRLDGTCSPGRSHVRVP